ncbi:hypothetical protein DL95DRAFT_386283, partial [Leptodontidium sp. 2 PMI_412]
MEFVTAIPRTLWALLTRAGEIVRQDIIMQTGTLECPFEPFPHEPTLYDSPMVMSALVAYFIGVTILGFFFGFIWSFFWCYGYWQIRTYMKWWEAVLLSRCNPEVQLEMLEKMCPGLEISIRSDSFNTQRTVLEDS